MLYTYIFAFFASLILALILTPIVLSLSIKHGKVSQVSHDRWHKTPTPFLGGIGIWVSFLVVVLFITFIPRVWDAPLLQLPDLSDYYLCLALSGASGMFVLGLVDDFVKLNPQIKLVAQIIIATVMVKFGIVIEIVPYPAIAIPLTIFWIVGITNAFNLLDNMDGLSGGIVGITALILFAFSLQSGNQYVAILALPMAGAAFGFLVYNFSPAKIFMGDSGSMFMGFLVSILAVVGTWKYATNVVVAISPPLLALGVPLFDTMFVTITRRLRGQKVSQGGKDHISHRLVSLGLSERRAVLVIYSISILFGALALFFSNVTPFVVLVISIIVAIILFFIGMFFREIDISNKNDQNKDKGNSGQVAVGKRNEYPLSKRSLVEIMMDIALVSIAYFSSYLIRTEGALSQPFFDRFVESCPWVIIIKCVIFYFMNMYKSHWRYVSIFDLIGIVKAVTISSLAIVFIAFMFARFSYGYSRSVFVIDWMLTLILVGGSRCFFRAFRELIVNYRVGGRNTLIVGAGNIGEIVLKQIKNNPMSRLKVVGFIDDDLHKLGSRIHGVKVQGSSRDLLEIADKNKVQEVVIAIHSASAATISRIESICKENGIKYSKIPEVDNVLEELVQPESSHNGKNDVFGANMRHKIDKNYFSSN